MENLSIEELFKDPSLHRFALSLCKNKSIAEDLVMDVITKLVENIGNLPEDTNLKAYSIKAIKNKFIDNCRRRRSMTENSETAEDGSTLLDRMKDEVAEARIHSPMELHQALNQLSESCRDILVKFGIGHTYEELASELGVKLGTVMSRMSRCRQTLSHKLELA